MQLFTLVCYTNRFCVFSAEDMDKIVVNGVLYEAIDFKHVLDNLQLAINYLQNAKKTVTDKNQKRAIRSCQKKIEKTFFKLQSIEKNKYSAKFNPLTDEQRLDNLNGIDKGLEQKFDPDKVRRSGEGH